MELIYTISLVILIIDLLFYYGRLLYLIIFTDRNAYTLGKGDKDPSIKINEWILSVSTKLFLLVWGLNCLIGLGIINFKLPFDFQFIGFIHPLVGLILQLSGFVLYMFASWWFRSSYKSGVDSSQGQKLVTDGIYSICRNPMVVGFVLMMLGTVIIFDSLFLLLLLLLLFFFFFFFFY